jgi:hypothetical protein
VKWKNNREIDPAEPIMRQHHGGGGDALAGSGGYDVDHDAKIKMAVVKARDKTVGGFAQHRKDPDVVSAKLPFEEEVLFRPKGVTRTSRNANNASIHRGERPSILCAACRALSAALSIVTLKASLNCAPASSAPVSASGSTAWTFTVGYSTIENGMRANGHNAYGAEEMAPHRGAPKRRVPASPARRFDLSLKVVAVYSATIDLAALGARPAGPSGESGSQGP